MHKLIVSPDRASYSVTDGTEVLRVELDGGAGRYRRDILGASYTVDVSWILRTTQYKYLRSFFTGILGRGSSPFLIDLIIDSSDLREYTAHFVPDSMKLTAQEGEAYFVSAKLEVDQPPDYDKGNFAIMCNGFGFDWINVEDKLDHIVNDLWPEVL